MQRYLAGEQVLAAPASTAYRLRKFVRRNKGPVLAASLVLLALLAGVAGTTWGLIEARRQQRRAVAQAREKEQARSAEAARAEGERQAKLEAEAKRIEAERERARAEESYRLARGAVDKYLARVGSSPRLQQAGLHSLRMDLIGEAAAFYDELIRLKGTDASLQADLVDALVGHAGVAHFAGQSAKAVQSAERARDLSERLLLSDPKDWARCSRAAKANQVLGSLLSDANAPDRAISCYERANEIRAQATGVDQTSEPWRAETAEVAYGFGLACQRAGRPDQAISLMEAAQQTFAELAATNKADNSTGSLKNREAGSLINLGLMYVQRRRWADAEKALDRAVVLFRELANASKEPWMQSGVGAPLANQANVYMATDRIGAAEVAYREVLAIYEDLARLDPELARWQESVAIGWNGLARVHLARSQFGQAVEARQKVVDVWEKLVRKYPTQRSYQVDVANARAELALARIQAGQTELAVTEVEETGQVRELALQHLVQLRVRLRHRQWQNCGQE